MTMKDSSLIFLYFVVHFEMGNTALRWKRKTEFLQSCFVIQVSLSAKDITPYSNRYALKT